jgi:hypothetical protein
LGCSGAELSQADHKLSFARPGDLQTNDLLEIERVVLEGGEVSPANVRERLEQAALIARLRDGNAVLAVAVLKRPALSYVQRLIKKSSYPGLSGEFLELGYISVLRQHQDKKLGKQITAEIVKQVSSETSHVKLFATTRKDSVRHILSLNGFHQEGQQWPSKEHPGSNLDLWVLIR